MNLIKTTDRRQALTYNEMQQIELALKDRTDILNSGTDYKVGDKETIYFYWFKIKKFETYPMFIGWVHQQYGRGIDIRTLYTDDEDVIEINFRGYARELL